MSFNRREFLKLLGAAGVTGLVGSSLTGCSTAQATPHVVIVGGGIGGSTAAKYLRFADPGVKITLIDPAKEYLTCLRSSDVIVGHVKIEEITFTHATLRDEYGVNIVQEKVIGLDATKREVSTESGTKIGYDRLIVAPGIDFRWDAIEGYSQEASTTTMPHGWKAGPQTLLLKQQLEAMPQGGLYVMVAPPNPYRCPPGPYERASLIAEYFKKNNPTAKILVLDPKDAFTKQAAFIKGWERLYGYGTDQSILEWVSGAQGGTVLSVDPKSKSLKTDFEDYQADAVNFIPAQKAPQLVYDMGLTDESGWCPVDRRSFESSLVPNVHVIGDSCIADAMPKSGYSANSQAKVTAQAIADLMAGREPGEPSLLNVCVSLVGVDYGISVAAIYKLIDGKIGSVADSGGVSPITDSPAQPLLESIYQPNWHRTFAKDVFA